MQMQNNMTINTAKEILQSYCNLHELSYSKLMEFTPRKTGTGWIWVKPYNGPLTDENGNIMDLQTMPIPIIFVDTNLMVHERDGIGLIKP